MDGRIIATGVRWQSKGSIGKSDCPRNSREAQVDEWVGEEIAERVGEVRLELADRY